MDLGVYTRNYVTQNLTYGTVILATWYFLIQTNTKIYNSSEFMSILVLAHFGKYS